MRTVSFYYGGRSPPGGGYLKFTIQKVTGGADRWC